MKKRKLATGWKKGTTTVTTNVYVPLPEKSLSEMEKEFDLASARFTYALEQKKYWDREVHQRSQVFDEANTAFKKKKGGFTDEQIRDNPKVSTAVWSYAQ
jgi:hypothetical protein